MLLMPAAAAFFRQAPPESESRLTIIRTWTPSLIMLSQIVPNLALSPPAFWMSDSMPASSKAFFRLGRSLASQRGDVVASGRITPDLLGAPHRSRRRRPPSLPLSELPHARAERPASRPTAASDVQPRTPASSHCLDLSASGRGGVTSHHDVCCAPQHSPPTRPLDKAPRAVICCLVRTKPDITARTVRHARVAMMTSSTPRPTREDKFSFGLWTVGWQGVDVFGSAIRPPMDPAEAVRRLAELGAYGITFHDNDVFPFDADAGRARSPTWRTLRKALEETGLVVPMVTTNLFSHPVFRDGGFTNNDRDVRRFALRKVAGQHRPGRRARGAGRSSPGAVARVPSPARPRTSARRWTATRRPSTCSAQYVLDQGYDLRFAIEPKPNEPRGDILLPTIGHALAFIDEPRAPRAGRGEPRGRPRGDGLAQLRPRHRPGAVARQALPHRPQRPDRPALRPGPPLRRRQRARRLLDRRHRRERRVRRPAALRLQAAAHRGHRRRVGLGARRACATT